LHSYNLGPKGLAGKNNFLTTLYACRGKYIALCDGDDYWTNENKLQKQVDFLEANSEYSICFTNSYVANESEGFEFSEKKTLFDKSEIDKTIEQDSLLYSNCLLTPTTLFRNTGKPLPHWFMKVQFGDWSLHIINSFNGKIKYLSDVTGVYRRHGKGVFASLNSKKQLINYLNTGEIIRKNISKQAADKMKPGQVSRLRNLLQLFLEDNERKFYIFYLIKYRSILPAREFIGSFLFLFRSKKHIAKLEK
jgi:hypothetical protein